MTTQEPPPMSAALRALVAADQQRPGPSDRDRRRVLAALGVSVGVIPAGAVVVAHAASAGVATAAAQGGSTAVATAVGAASAVGRIALIIKAPLVSVGVGALLGATLTAYVVQGPVARWTASARARRAAAAAHLAPPREAPAPVAAPTVALEDPSAAPTVETTPVVVPARHAPSIAREKLTRAAVESDEPRAAPDVGTLAAEQALLDPARSALAHGDGAGALARLALHEQRFPAGALAQEREAMTIRALVVTGDGARARSRAESFRARYPGSLLWPMIAATLDATSDGTARSPR